MKPNVIIRMGASKWTAHVRTGNEVVAFDLNKLDKRGQHAFRVELTKAFRQSRQAA